MRISFQISPMVGANYARSPATAPVAWPSRCFNGVRSRDAKVIRALGVEVFEFVGGRIKEVRDYHRLVV